MKGNIGDSYKRQFVDGKISKIKFVIENDDTANRFLTGFWNSSIKSINYYEIVDNEIFSTKCLGTLETKSDVNDIKIISSNKFVAGLGDGTIKFVDYFENGTLNACHTTKKLFNNRISSLCLVRNFVYAGSDNGQIVRITSSLTEISSDIFANNLMGVSSLESCGPNNFVSGHLTGQIHLWDVRTNKVSFTIPEMSHYLPKLSRAASTLNDAITAIASHPAEPNVISYGTSSGSVSFIDIRNPEKNLPSLLKVAKDSIHELKFNPSYPGHFFSLSNSNFIHWDTSSINLFDLDKNSDEMNLNLSNEELKENDTFSNFCFGNHAEKYKRTNVWLSSKVWDLVQLKALVEDDPKYISSFDISKDTIVIGSNTSELIIFPNFNY